MAETFLILLAGGIMLAAACPATKSVTLRWLRLAGILSLCGVGLSAYFFYRWQVPKPQSAWQWLTVTGVLVMVQLAGAQLAWRSIQRFAAAMAFIAAIATAILFIRHGADHLAELSRSQKAATLAGVVGVAAVCGLSLMEMLLGHAYLTSSRMTMAPFRRMNRLLGSAIFIRALLATAGVEFLQLRHPVEMLWMRFALYAGVRWLVGLLAPAVFIYMAGVCIRRRATQSATGILYVTCVLTFAGELIGLYLVRETGLPF